MSEEKLNVLENKLDQLDKAVSKVLYYIVSDPTTNRKGLVEELDSLKATLNDVIVREKVYKAKATVWGMVGAAVLSIAWQVIKHLIPSLK